MRWCGKSRGPARGTVAGAMGALIVAGVLGAVMPGASAADEGVLAGAVINGTSDGSPAPGISVMLHAYQGDVEVSTKSAETGADGRFEFAGLPVGSERSYALSTEYQDVAYATESVSLSPGEVKALDLTIYEPGGSLEKLTITEWLVWVDREGSAIAVQHDVTVQNSGTKTYMGDEDLGEGKKAVMRLPLPPDATNFQYLGHFMQCCAVVEGDTFIHTAAVQPGLSSGTIRVSTGELSRLDLTAQLPTDTLRVFVPAGADVTVPAAFEADGTIEDLGTTYQAFEARSVSPGEMLSFGVKGLSGSGGRSLLWPVVAAVAVVLAAVAFLVMRRRSGTGSRPSRKADGSAHRSAAERTREMIVDEVAALDVAFERGALPADTYHRLREEKIAEILESSTASGEVRAE